MNLYSASQNPVSRKKPGEQKNNAFGHRSPDDCFSINVGECPRDLPSVPDAPVPNAASLLPEEWLRLLVRYDTSALSKSAVWNFWKLPIQYTYCHVHAAVRCLSVLYTYCTCTFITRLLGIILSIEQYQCWTTIPPYCMCTVQYNTTIVFARVLHV